MVRVGYQMADLSSVSQQQQHTQLHRNARVEVVLQHMTAVQRHRRRSDAAKEWCMQVARTNAVVAGAAV